MFLDPVPTLGSHKLSTGTGSSDLIGPAQSLEAPLLNYTKAQSVKPLDTSSPTNILCVLSQLGIVEKSAVLDVRRLPSIDDRKKARTKADITGKAFATLERVFSQIVTGVLKMLLPAWHVPDKMWKQMIHIPIENATEDIDDEGTVIPPITADASKHLYNNNNNNNNNEASNGIQMLLTAYLYGKSLQRLERSCLDNNDLKTLTSLAVTMC